MLLCCADSLPCGVAKSKRTFATQADCGRAVAADADRPYRAAADRTDRVQGAGEPDRGVDLAHRQVTALGVARYRRICDVAVSIDGDRARRTAPDVYADYEVA